MKQPVKWVSPKLNLAGWKGDKKTLDYLMHERGLIRLGHAISDEDPHFRFYLLHRLDTGRAKLVQKASQERMEAPVVASIKRQVLDIAKRYQK